jgi:hypothetical protein
MVTFDYRKGTRELHQGIGCLRLCTPNP